MTVPEIMLVVLLFSMVLFCLIVSLFQFARKGFLFNNAYLWATKEEREKMNKKPYYLQSGIVFSLLSAVFLVIALALLLQMKSLLYIEIPLIIILIIYTMISSILIWKNSSENS